MNVQDFIIIPVEEVTETTYKNVPFHEMDRKAQHEVLGRLLRAIEDLKKAMV